MENVQNNDTADYVAIGAFGFEGQMVTIGTLVYDLPWKEALPLLNRQKIRAATEEDYAAWAAEAAAAEAAAAEAADAEAAAAEAAAAKPAKSAPAKGKAK